MTGLAAWRPPLAVIFALLGAQARPIAIFSRRSPPPPRLPPPPPPPMWLWSALVAAPPPPPLPPLLYRRPRAARSASRDASSTSTAGASTAALDPDPHGSNTSGDAHATGRSHRHDDDDTFVGAGGCGEHCRRSKGKYANGAPFIIFLLVFLAIPATLWIGDLYAQRVIKHARYGSLERVHTRSISEDASFA
mmetsp:Transcript_35516/g.113628  ORF Transcript_35516/g.113628 Transcript_35516/m.113628 type:complete len:192 (+) Transcript_35516:127-702(+)